MRVRGDASYLPWADTPEATQKAFTGKVAGVIANATPAEKPDGVYMRSQELEMFRAIIRALTVVRS